MQKTIILYGFAGAEGGYRCLRYYILDKELCSIDLIKYHTSSKLLDVNPDIEFVYAVDNRAGLRREYMEAIKDTKNPIESALSFKDMIENEGIRII